MVPLGGAGEAADVAVQRPWRMRSLLSRTVDATEAFLAASGFDRAPWLAVAFAGGIGTWFWLADASGWLSAIVVAMGAAFCAGQAGWLRTRPTLRNAIVALALAWSLGLIVVWARSAMVGAPPIERPAFEQIDARILEREERPAQDRVRLVLATREAGTGRAIRVRVNVPLTSDAPGLEEGARIRLAARLMPPSPPILPGAYDFARTSWFEGYAATGSLVGDIELVEPAPAGSNDSLQRIQRSLSAHVRGQVEGSAGTIAAAFASGDRGGIDQADEDAMRDAGLTHLLSISGLHVSAVIAATYFLAIKLLALWPWLVLRVRLPLVAAGLAAGAGIGYTLLTGAEVPTVRSCIGAVLVLIALALGRDALSMRMVAVAAVCVLLFWPESLVGPSFQMSFAAVIAIIALHGAEPVRAFLAPREEGALRWLSRRVLMLFLTGLVIEIALMPIVLFHFHRAGLYGAAANVLAIPLVTFVSMPLIALGLLADSIGLGAPFWWAARHSLDLMLAIAHFTAEQPGSVKLFPHMGLQTVMLFVSGALWLALWRGRARLLGLLPVLLGATALAMTPVADIFVTRDGQNMGIKSEDGTLHLLRLGAGSYAQTNLVELAAIAAEPVAIGDYPGARCSTEFCSLTIPGEARSWSLLVARNRQRVDELQLAAACERADVVIADRWLPRSCRPSWLKIDRRYLAESGGLAIFLDEERVDMVASGQGRHGWWRPHEPVADSKRAPASASALKVGRTEGRQ